MTLSTIGLIVTLVLLGLYFLVGPALGLILVVVLGISCLVTALLLLLGR